MMIWEVPKSAIPVTKEEFCAYMDMIDYYRDSYGGCVLYRRRHSKEIVGYWEKEVGRYFLEVE